MDVYSPFSSSEASSTDWMNAETSTGRSHSEKQFSMEWYALQQDIISVNQTASKKARLDKQYLPFLFCTEDGCTESFKTEKLLKDHLNHGEHTYIPIRSSMDMTSIMAVEFDGGVVIGADSRTTQGSYIGNRVTNKLYKVTDNIYCCRSGSAADTEAVADAVAYHLGLLRMQLDEPVSVQVAANDFKQLCYSYRDSLSVGVIIAGWDRKKGGQVYSIPLGGMMSREKCCAGGSGSSYIYGFIDEFYKPKMTKEECVEFVAKGLAHAMWRDGHSGGVIRLCTITEKGAERKTIIGDQVPQYFQQ